MGQVSCPEKSQGDEKSKLNYLNIKKKERNKMNEQNTIIITQGEYEALLRAQERIEVVERLVNETQYVSTEDIYVVLGIKRKVVAQ